MLSYGQFSEVKNYLVMVVKKGDNHDERIGYYGEQLVLLAQTLGLNTCWVGLSYRKVPEAYHVGNDEKLACMIALGYGETQGVSHKIKIVEDVSNASDITSSWFKKGGKLPCLLQQPWISRNFRLRMLVLVTIIT